MDRTAGFRAMGSAFEVMGPHDPSFDAAYARIRSRVAREEHRFSRFRGDSELVRVNEAAGSPTVLSRSFAEVLGLALEAAIDTAGRFDPSVHDAMIAAGYDRDLDEVLAGARGVLNPAVPCGRWREIELDDDRLLLPAGVHLDLGGIVKGWTADRAVQDALEEGLPWALVSAGGDLRIGGDAPGVEVAIEDPVDPDRRIARLTLTQGALATSSVLKRAWGDGLHHVIDPFTGAPADTDLLQATVWAPTCAEAEVRATAALLEGRSALGVTPGIVVTADAVFVSMPTEAAA